LVSDIDDRDLRGSTLADYLIAIDADLEIREDGRIIYAEPTFPVVELARSLASWIAIGERENFVFESLSFEESGVVTIARARDGWCLSSVFTPDVVSSEIDDSELASSRHLQPRGLSPLRGHPEQPLRRR
jgi:hypothetical protein